MKRSHEVELRGNTNKYRTEFGKAIKSNAAFTNSLDGLSKGATAIQGPMGGVASRISVLKSLASSGAVTMAGFAAGLAGLTAAAYKSVKVFDEYQRGQLRTEALVRATGSAAGYTAEQLQQQANEVALATLASVGGIVEAQNVLMTFKSVSGETFKQAIMLSQDMAAVFGGSAKDKALQLGKALEDPVQGINALRRSGVSFTAQQKEQIRTMTEAGDVAGAQQVVLSQLAAQVGGAGAAEAGGLSGAVDTLSQRWDELLLSFSETSSAGSVVTTWINNIASGLDGLRGKINPTVSTLEQELAALQVRRAKAEAGQNTRRGRRGPSPESFDAEIAALQDQILIAKAQSDDLDAITALIADRQSRIATLDGDIAAASSRRRRGGGSDKQDLKNEQAALQEELERYQAHYEKLQAQSEAHAATQAQIQEEQRAAGEALSNEKAERAAADAERQAAADAREVASVRAKYAQLQEAALEAQGQDIELENLKYERQQLALENELTRLREKGLLTQEIEAEHKAALEDLETAHQARINEIKTAARDEEEKAEAEKNERISAGYQSLLGIIGSYYDGMQGKQAGYVRMALSLGGLLLDEKKRESIQTIWAETYEGAMSARSAMAGIPIVGPALGELAYGAIILAGGASVAKVAGMAHKGMTNIPGEGTYILDGGERVVAEEQNKDLTNYMRAQQQKGAGGEAPKVQVFNSTGESVRVVTHEDVVKILVGQTVNQASEFREALHSTSTVEPRGRR